MGNDDVKFLTVTDLYAILPLGRNNVYKLVDKEGFPKLKIGKKIIIPAAEFYKWMRENLGSEILL